MINIYAVALLSVVTLDCAQIAALANTRLIPGAAPLTVYSCTSAGALRTGHCALAAAGRSDWQVEAAVKSAAVKSAAVEGQRDGRGGRRRWRVAPRVALLVRASFRRHAGRPRRRAPRRPSPMSGLDVRRGLMSTQVACRRVTSWIDPFSSVRAAAACLPIRRDREHLRAASALGVLLRAQLAGGVLRCRA